MVNGFHVKDGLYFTRNDNGSVTITVTESGHIDSPVLRSFDVGIDGFASVVASMSARSEEYGGFYAAREFLTDDVKKE